MKVNVTYVYVLSEQVHRLTFENVFHFIRGYLECVRSLRSVIVKLLIDVALCLLRLSHTEALYKQTFDPLMHSNYILYILVQ